MSIFLSACGTNAPLEKPVEVTKYEVRIPPRELVELPTRPTVPSKELLEIGMWEETTSIFFREELTATDICYDRHERLVNWIYGSKEILESLNAKK